MEEFSATFNFCFRKKIHFFSTLAFINNKEIDIFLLFWGALEHITFVRLYKHIDRKSIVNVH